MPAPTGSLSTCSASFDACVCLCLLPFDELVDRSTAGVGTPSDGQLDPRLLICDAYFLVLPTLKNLGDVGDGVMTPPADAGLGGHGGTDVGRLDCLTM